jgi:exopolysaccharide biosynthesis polyprenyl glycosylphosphotransferase
MSKITLPRQRDFSTELAPSARAATRVPGHTRRGRGWLVRRMLLAADLVGLTVAFLLTQYLSGAGDAGQVSVRNEFMLFLLVLPGWVLAAKLYGLYDRDEERTDHSTADDLVGVFNVISIGSWGFVVGAALTGLADVNLPKILVFWGFAVVLVSTARATARGICRRQAAYIQRTIVVGAGDVGQLVARKILCHPEYGLEVAGFVDAAPVEAQPETAHLPIVGELDELPELIDRLDIDRVIFAFSSESHDSSLAALRACRDLRVQSDIVPRLFEMVGPGAALNTLGGMSLVTLGPTGLPRSSQWVKRAFDIMISATLLVVFAPFLALIALLVKLDSPGPAFFRQTRMGAVDRPFRIYKFRTMVLDAEEQKGALGHLNRYAVNGGDTRMFKAKDDPRTTRLGRRLRRFSLDELPQLVNVLRGEMSMVGPRPLILDEDQQIADWGRRRLAVKPGITGPWQVLGRNDIPFSEMVAMDYLYVTNWSLMHDIALMLRTVPAVVRARDVY